MSLRRAGVRGILLALGIALVPSGARAGDTPSSPPPARDTYAGRPATWWVVELRGAGTQRVAQEALKVIGAPAIPAIAAVLNDVDPVVRDTSLTLLSEIAGPMDPARDAVREALELSTDLGRDARLLPLVGRMETQGALLAPLVVARLTAHRGDLRPRALTVLEKTGGSAEVLVPAMRALLASDDGQTVVTSLRVLQKVGAEAAPAVPDVLALLDDPPASGQGYRRRGRRNEVVAQSIALLQRIGRVGPAAHAALAALVRDPESGWARPAAQALGEIALAEPAAADVLVALLEAPQPVVRSEALGALGGLRPLPPGAVTAVVGLLDSAPPEVAYQAVQLLQSARVDPEVYLSTVVRALERSTSPGPLLEAVRTAANASPVAFVQAIPDDLAAPSGMLAGIFQQFAPAIGASTARARAVGLLTRWLARATGPTDPRAQFVETLVRLGGDGADLPPALEPLLLGEDAFRAGLASAVLARVPAGRAHALVLLGHGDAARRRAGLRMLEPWSAPRSAAEDGALRDLLDDPEPDLRAGAAVLLVLRPGGSGLVPSQRPIEERAALCAALAGALADADPAKRTQAISALALLGTACPAAVDPLVAALSDAESTVDPSLVAGTLLTVAGSDTRALRRRLLERLDPARSEIDRAGAALALATMGEETEAVRTALPALLEGGPWSARWRALLTVGRLGDRGRTLEPQVRALVAHPHHSVSCEACRVLGGLGTVADESRAALRALAGDRAKAWRAVAVGPLGALGGAATQDLVSLLEDPELRGAVLSTLQAMGPLAHDALPALEAELARRPEDAALRRTVEALRRP